MRTTVALLMSLPGKVVRDISDDYDSGEPALRTGEPVTVVVDDVKFNANRSATGDPLMTVYVDGQHVLSVHFGLEKLDWKMQSPKLETHVCTAALELESRYDALAASKRAAKAKEDADAAAGLAAFRARFEIED